MRYVIVAALALVAMPAAAQSPGDRVVVYCHKGEDSAWMYYRLEYLAGKPIPCIYPPVKILRFTYYGEYKYALIDAGKLGKGYISPEYFDPKVMLVDRLTAMMRGLEASDKYRSPECATHGGALRLEEERFLDIWETNGWVVKTRHIVCKDGTRFARP